MGLLDFTTKVLTEYKADISDHKAKIKDLTGAQKELAKQELAASEARNKQIEDQIKGLAKVGVAVGAAVAAVKIGQAGFEEWSKYQTLSARTSTESLDKLKEASGGLRTEMDLLSFSAKTQHGIFALTTEQQETALKAMRALEKQGFDSEQVFNKVTDALVKLEVDGLKDFGIAVDQGVTKGGTFKNLMSALSGEVAKAGGELGREGDDVRRLGVQWDDALSKLKRAIGEVVVALGPLLSVIGDIGSALADVVGGIESWLKDQQARSDIQLRNQTKAIAAFNTPGGLTRATGNIGQDIVSGRQATLADVLPAGGAVFTQTDLYNAINIARGLGAAAGQRAILAGIGDSIRNARKGRKGGGGAGSKYSGIVAPDYSARDSPFIVEDAGLGGMVDTAGLSAFGDSAFGETIGFQDLINARGAELAKSTASGSSGKDGDKMLGKIFGPLSEFNAYSAGFDMLRGSVEAAFSAWITGSDSALGASRKFLAGYLNNMSTLLFSESVKELAYGIAYSFIPMRAAEAPGHFAAAAKFAAASVAIGGLSAALGGGGAGGSGASTGAAAPVGSASSGASSGASSRPITVILGDETGEESPRRRQNRAAAALERARRVTSADDGVIYG